VLASITFSLSDGTLTKIGKFSSFKALDAVLALSAKQILETVEPF